MSGRSEAPPLPPNSSSVMVPGRSFSAILIQRFSETQDASHINIDLRANGRGSWQTALEFRF